MDLTPPLLGEEVKAVEQALEGVQHEGFRRALVHMPAHAAVHQALVLQRHGSTCGDTSGQEWLFSMLPTSVLALMMARLTSLSQLAAAFAVCRRWSELRTDSTMWRTWLSRQPAHETAVRCYGAVYAIRPPVLHHVAWPDVVAMCVSRLEPRDGPPVLRGAHLDDEPCRIPSLDVQWRQEDATCRPFVGWSLGVHQRVTSCSLERLRVEGMFSQPAASWPPDGAHVVYGRASYTLDESEALDSLPCSGFFVSRLEASCCDDRKVGGCGKQVRLTVCSWPPCQSPSLLSSCDSPLLAWYAEYVGSLDTLARPHGHGCLRVWKRIPVSSVSAAGAEHKGGWHDAQLVRKYDGDWLNGMEHGTGHGVTWSLPDAPDSVGLVDRSHRRFEYSGQWVRCQPHGEGTASFGCNGATYTGSWRAGKRDGTGEAVGSNGANWCSYSGGFRGGQRHGQGSIAYRDGSSYTGGWCDGKQHGSGSWSAAPDADVATDQVQQYTGACVAGRFQGQGNGVFGDGSTYVGAWADGVPHGRGCKVAVSGEKLEGVWHHGVYEPEANACADQVEALEPSSDPALSSEKAVRSSAPNKVCVKCSSALKGAARFCTKCGAKQPAQTEDATRADHSRLRIVPTSEQEPAPCTDTLRRDVDGMASGVSLSSPAVVSNGGEADHDDAGFANMVAATSDSLSLYSGDMDPSDYQYDEGDNDDDDDIHVMMHRLLSPQRPFSIAVTNDDIATVRTASDDHLLLGAGSGEADEDDDDEALEAELSLLLQRDRANSERRRQLVAGAIRSEDPAQVTPTANRGATASPLSRVSGGSFGDFDDFDFNLDASPADQEKMLLRSDTVVVRPTPPSPAVASVRPVVGAATKFNVFSGSISLHDATSPTNLALVDPGLDYHVYKHRLASHSHQCLFGNDEAMGYFILCVGSSSHHLVCILFSKYGVEELPPLSHRGVRSAFSRIKLLRGFLCARYGILAETKLRRLKLDCLTDRLCELEASLHCRQYKFGVLYARQGQVLENDMFTNCDASPGFDNFLQLLGHKVALRGWKGYRAGLDVTRGTTGTHSVFTKYTWNPATGDDEGSVKDDDATLEFDVMYHVSTMLPFYPHDEQQLERKRHLGNDIVVLVYMDGDTTFVPTCVASEFIHVFVVVQPTTADPIDGCPRYRIGVTAKADVPPFPPRLPEPPVFRHGFDLKCFLTTLMINAERSAYHAPVFATKLERTRHAQLRLLVGHLG